MKNDQNILDQATDIAQLFLGAQELTVKTLVGGNTNISFTVKTPTTAYILQRITPVVPTTTIRSAVDLSNALNKHGIRAPQFVTKEDGEVVHITEDNNRWRMYERIDGNTYDTVSDPELIKAAAYYLSKIHEALAQEQLEFTPIPHFHDYQHYADHLAERVDALPLELQQFGRDILEELRAAGLSPEEFGKEIPIHGDPKISNFVFDDEGVPVAILDLDTAMYHSKYIDIGDAVRSWCVTRPEDDPEGVLVLPLIEAFYEGYAGQQKSEEDKQGLYTVVKATRLIALELAARFLADVVDDSYFGFDSNRFESRAAHNTQRAKAQYNLASSALGIMGDLEV